jgi:hypothetical protein
MHVSLYDRVSFVPFVPSRVGRFTRLIDYDEDAIELLLSCVLRSILCILYLDFAVILIRQYPF